MFFGLADADCNNSARNWCAADGRFDSRPVHGGADLLSIIDNILKLSFTLLCLCKAFPGCGWTSPEPVSELPQFRFKQKAAGGNDLAARSCIVVPATSSPLSDDVSTTLPRLELPLLQDELGCIPANSYFLSTIKS